MSEHKPDWYDRLKSPIFRQETFTRELAYRIERKGFAKKPTPGTRWILPAVVAFSLLIAAALMFTYGSDLLGKKTTAVTPTPPPTESSPPTPAPTTEQTPTPAPTPLASPSEDELSLESDIPSDVIIQLANEPVMGQTQWARRAVQITAGTQEYKLQFAEKMDRNSVEEAIINNWNKADYPGLASSVPDFAFDWKSDTEVNIAVTAQRGNNYRLDARKAKTAAGGHLAHVGVLDAVVSPALQLWSVNIEKKTKERMAELTEPYRLTPLAEERRYLLASRSTSYCECDAPFPRLFGVYDPSARKLVKYPVELYQTYMGPGDFVADTRGFFYTKPAEGVTVPASSTAIPVHIDGHVFGTGFSADRSLLLIATGADNNPERRAFDLLVYRLSDGSVKKYPEALKGVLPQNVLTGGFEPLSFINGGGLVISNMKVSEKSGNEYYAYSIDENKVSVWKSPSRGGAIPVEFTTDRAFAFYNDTSIYKGDRKLDRGGKVLNLGRWVPATHQFLHLEPSAGSGNTLQLYLLDADTGEDRLLMKDLPNMLHLLGISDDGKSALFGVDGSW